MWDDFDFGADQVEWPSGPSLPDAGDCLRCGLCLTACPTYRLFKSEDQSPRRRVRTLRKLLVENVPIDSGERLHLNDCVQCRACETVCPSKMAYGQFFDQARVLAAAPPHWAAKAAFGLIEHKKRLARLLPFIALYHHSGLGKWLRRSGLLRALGLAEAEALAATPALRALAKRYAPERPCLGRVALFTGCLAEPFDRDTLLSAIALLNAIGYEVVVPREQQCCGAIHQHNGRSASRLIENNLRVFNALDVEAVVYCASGCGAMLSEYPGDDREAERFRRRLSDVNEFLLAHWPDDLALKPFVGKIAVHEPCSQRNVLKNQHAVYALLAKIPGAEVAPLGDNATCCGAGGSYMLTHPGIAAELKTIKRAAIDAASVDAVVSGNFGCAMFLNSGDAPKAPLLHPLVLMAGLLPV